MQATLHQSLQHPSRLTNVPYFTMASTQEGSPLAHAAQRSRDAPEPTLVSLARL